MTLQFQKRLEEDQHKNNLQTLYVFIPNYFSLSPIVFTIRHYTFIWIMLQFSNMAVKKLKLEAVSIAPQPVAQLMLMYIRNICDFR